jgi:hypothetical protein
MLPEVEFVYLVWQTTFRIPSTAKAVFEKHKYVNLKYSDYSQALF